MPETLKLACANLYPPDKVLIIEPSDLSDLSKIVTMMIHGSGVFMKTVRSNASMNQYEYTPSAKELKIRNETVSKYIESHLNYGPRFSADLEAELEDMMCEYQSHRFNIREFDKEKVWSEVGKILTRKYFQQLSKFQYPAGKFMLHEMRWYLKLHTRGFCKDVLSSLKRGLPCAREPRLLLLTSYDPLSWSKSVAIFVDDNFDPQSILDNMPKVTSKSLILACKSAAKTPPFSLDSEWAEMDEYFSFTHDTVRGLVNSISIGKKIVRDEENSQSFKETDCE